MRILPVAFKSQTFAATTPMRGHLALAGSIAAGAWAVIFMRLAQQEGVPSLYIGPFRLALAALILAPIVLSKHRAQLRVLNTGDWLHILASGFFVALLFAAAPLSLERTSVLIAAVVFAMNPLWIALLELFILKAPMKRSLWLGLTLTLTGSVVVATSGEANVSLGQDPLLGAGLALVGSLAVAFYAIVGRKIRHRIPLLPYMWLVFIIGAVCATAFLLLTDTPLTGYSSRGYMWLILITLIPQLINHVAYNYALRHLPATYCSIFGQLEVLLTVTIAYFLFREVPGILQIPGSIVVLLGVALVSLSQPQTD